MDHFNRQSCKFDSVEFWRMILSQTSSTPTSQESSSTRPTTALTSSQTSLYSSCPVQSPSPTPFVQPAFRHATWTSTSSKSASTPALDKPTTLVTSTFFCHFNVIIFNLCITTKAGVRTVSCSVNGSFKLLAGGHTKDILHYITQRRYLNYPESNFEVFLPHRGDALHWWVKLA